MTTQSTFSPLFAQGMNVQNFILGEGRFNEFAVGFGVYDGTVQLHIHERIEGAQLNVKSRRRGIVTWNEDGTFTADRNHVAVRAVLTLLEQFDPAQTYPDWKNREYFCNFFGLSESFNGRVMQD